MIFQVLNGDALKARFPSQIEGVQLVCRECLVDGPAPVLQFPEFYVERAAFIQEAYGDPREGYFAKVVPALEQIRQAPNGSELNLWFEKDLFCQVNLWFLLALLGAKKKALTINLVVPESEIQYGFAGLTDLQLLETYQNRRLLTEWEMEALEKLWPAYQSQDREALLRIASSLISTLPFIGMAVGAQLALEPEDGTPGKAIQTLERLKREIGNQFGPVFQAFSKEEAIYGFGDLQVKRMWEALS